MAGLEVRNHDQADETRPFVDKGRVEIVKLAGGTIGRLTCEPGWRWSEHVRPIAGTESCQASHMGYCISGRMVVRMDDGTEKEIGTGTCSSSPRPRRVGRGRRAVRPVGLHGHGGLRHDRLGRRRAPASAPRSGPVRLVPARPGRSHASAAISARPYPAAATAGAGAGR